eukprot:363954-Chlamydomonas_euryale.AAC.5
MQEYCNASLYDALKQQLLHNKETKVPDMDLVLSILIDIAKGLIYIHAKVGAQQAGHEMPACSAPTATVLAGD